MGSYVLDIFTSFFLGRQILPFCISILLKIIVLLLYCHTFAPITHSLLSQRDALIHLDIPGLAVHFRQPDSLQEVLGTS